MCHKNGWTELLNLALNADGMNYGALFYCITFIFILNYFIFGLLISVLFEEFSEIQVDDEIIEIKKNQE